jgi:glycosyltransferase involved in cell wall biosynthesis
VGDGKLIDQTRALAESLGIADRVLFVGLSSSVGFWYSKMNVKVLLSRYEGMPNVLIEAQKLGVPVVSTPAGGAEECFIHGESGHLLDCADTPDLDDACAAIARLAQAHVTRHVSISNGQARAQELFSTETSLRKFVRLCEAETSLAPTAAHELKTRPARSKALRKARPSGSRQQRPRREKKEMA